MLEFFLDLFEADTFMPHGQCFMWRPEVLWLHVISDAVITLAYFSIPVAILYIAYRRQALSFRWVYFMFGAFIFLCGLTHLINIWVLWDPVYRFQGVVKMLTGAVSIATAFLIIPIIPYLLQQLQSFDKNFPKE